MSFQVCHCGWTKVTSYHGLRIHQGKKGCTPRGQHIPQHVHNLTYNGPRVRGGPLSFLETFTPADSVPWADAWRLVSENELQRRRTPLMELPPAAEHERTSVSVNQRCYDMAVTPIKKLQVPSANQAAVLERKKASFETPERVHGSSSRARRALEFPPFEQQVDYFIESPGFQDQVTGPRPNEKKEKVQNPHKSEHASLNVETLKNIQAREKKLSEIKLSAGACKGRLDDELMEINHVFSEVMEAVQDAWRKAREPLEERRRRVKDEARAVIGELQHEIQQLKGNIEEMEKHPTLQRLSEKNWEDVKLDTRVSLGSLRAATSSMMSQIQRSVEGLCALELRRIPAFTMDVKLDRDSAHQRLVISDDLKSVSDGGDERELPNVTERFDAFASILGLNVITGGKAYWQVDVGDKSGWDLGVARRDATRKGKLSLDPDNGYWVTVRYEGHKYAAMSSPPLRLWPGADPGTVGVFVDYEEGLVSFYDVTNKSHIHTFAECSFGGYVLPYFSPHLKQKNNAKPLIISAV